MAEYEIRDDRLYTKTHEWALKESENRVRVGITDYAVKKLGDIIYVELPEVGTEVTAGSDVATIDSVKASESIYAPVSGKIIETNEDVVNDTTKIMESPYDDGWLFVIELSNPEELNSLLSPEDYRKLIEEEEA
ncbi:MAG TPA: glycine cleavage system protein GcvH [Thermoprotei archaeon]|nr:glycine cleavage system protein GcvH [Euryarchaeota archaeon]HDJ51038.1 glycine cleavage system protein GcvH [Thermoprotei archaeon]